MYAVEHVVGRCQHQPLALGQIHMLVAVVELHLALLLPWIPRLRLAMLYPVNDLVGQRVDLGRYAVGLIEDNDLAAVVQESVHVSACPSVQCLVIIPCYEKTGGPFSEFRHDSPL